MSARTSTTPCAARSSSCAGRRCWRARPIRGDPPTMCLALAVATAATVFSLGSSADTTVSVSRGTELQVANFAGEVTVRSWEKNAVRIQTEAEGDDNIIVKESDMVLLVKAYSKRAVRHSVDLEI